MLNSGCSLLIWNESKLFGLLELFTIIQENGLNYLFFAKLTAGEDKIK